MRLVLIISVLFIAACSNEMVEDQGKGSERQFVAVDETADTTVEAIESNMDTVVSDTSETYNGYVVVSVDKGNGKRVQAGDCVLFDYSLMNVRGDVLDGSEKLGFPIAVIQGKRIVVQGLDEAFTYMHVGERSRVSISPEMGFGEEYENRLVQKGEDIIYDVTIREVIEPLDTGGVKVYVIREGNGTPVESGDQIGMDYIGFLSDGKVFDSSRKSEGVYDFHVGKGRVVPGLDMALPKLNVGDQAYVVIPATQAFGANGLQDLVPPNEDIFYKVTIDYKK